MELFLRIYLIITGILAALAITFPGLILIGLIAFILPGIILGCAPTAFLYGLLFAVGWYLTRDHIGPLAASLVGILVAAAVGWGVPFVLRETSQAEIAAATAADVTPGAPITLAGTVAYVMPQGSLALMTLDPKARNRVSRPQCDDLCLALLFTPGVTIVQPQVEGQNGREILPTQYRLVRDGTCRSLPEAIPNYNTGMGRGEAVDSKLAMRIALADGICLVQEDATAKADMHLSVVSHREPKDRLPRWSFGTELDTRQFQVTRGGTVVARKTSAMLMTIAAPLYIDPGNLFSSRQDAHWGRTRTVRNLDMQNETLISYVGQVTNLRQDTMGLDIPNALRGALDAALADPARAPGSEAFRLVEAYLDRVSRDGARADDTARIARLLDDPRTTGLGNLGSALKALGPSAVQLREPIVRRVLATVDDREGTARAMGRTLGIMPPGTFATLTADERRLLADPALRVRALGLICRLSDQGGDATEPLVAILEQAYAPTTDPKKRRYPDNDTAEAAIKALSNLGPAAAAVLPRLEALPAKNLVPTHTLRSDEWVILLARLGKPVETFEKPANRSGTQEQYTARLQRDLAKYVPRRCW